MSKYREPAPNLPADDFRGMVQIVVDMMPILNDLREAFETDEAMHNLRAVFQPHVRLQMQIHSSRKYTRIRFMDLTSLTERVEAILKKHRCEIIGGSPFRWGEMWVEYCIPRLGPANETIVFGEQRPVTRKPIGATHGTV